MLFEQKRYHFSFSWSLPYVPFTLIELLFVEPALRFSTQAWIIDLFQAKRLVVFLLVKTEHRMSDICLLETYGLTLFTITGNRWAHVVLACGFHDYLQVDETPARMSALRCAASGPALTMHCLTNTKSTSRRRFFFFLAFHSIVDWGLLGLYRTGGIERKHTRKPK